MTLQTKQFKSLSRKPGQPINTLNPSTSYTTKYSKNSTTSGSSQRSFMSTAARINRRFRLRSNDIEETPLQDANKSNNASSRYIEIETDLNSNRSSDSHIQINNDPNNSNSEKMEIETKHSNSYSLLDSSGEEDQSENRNNNSIGVNTKQSEQSREEQEATNDEVDKSSDGIIIRKNSDILNQTFSIDKIIFRRGDEKQVTDEGKGLQVIFLKTKISVLNMTYKTKLNIPYNRIHDIKVSDNRRGINVSTLLFIIDGSISGITKIALKFKYSLSNENLKQLESFVAHTKHSRKYRARRPTQRESLVYFYTANKWKETNSEEFYKSTLGAASSTTNTNQSPSVMKNDFSSLSRGERSHRTNAQVKYMNEDEEDERANEKMVEENGHVQIADYIPEDEQLYFYPKLKYKFPNKKTFTISHDDFKCLYNENWINDSMLDFLLSYELHVAKETNLLKRHSVELMNSFFFTSLSRPLDNPNDNNYYQNVKTWFKNNDSLFDQDFIIVPVMQDLHWYVIVITNLKQLKTKHLKIQGEEISDENKEFRNKSYSNNEDDLPKPELQDQCESHLNTVNGPDDNSKQKPIKSKTSICTAQICVLDSLRRNHDDAIYYLRRFIIGYANDKFGFCVDMTEIGKRVCVVPQQKNFNDCGVHVLFNIHTMLQNPVLFNNKVLKRPTNRKFLAKALKENEEIFDKRERLYFRDSLRDLLFRLLKNQVEEENGDHMKVGTITVGEQRKIEMELLRDRNQKALEGENSNNDNKLLHSMNTDQSATNESDDDVMIIHVEKKEPVRESEISTPSSSSKEIKPSVKSKGDDIDPSPATVEIGKNKGHSTAATRKSSRLKYNRNESPNYIDYMSESSDNDRYANYSGNTKLKTKKSTSKRSRKPKSYASGCGNEKSSMNMKTALDLESDDSKKVDIKRDNTVRRRGRRKGSTKVHLSEPLSQDSYDGDQIGHEEPNSPIALFDTDDEKHSAPKKQEPQNSNEVQKQSDTKLESLVTKSLEPGTVIKSTENLTKEFNSVSDPEKILDSSSKGVELGKKNQAKTSKSELSILGASGVEKDIDAKDQINTNEHNCKDNLNSGKVSLTKRRLRTSTLATDSQLGVHFNEPITITDHEKGFKDDYLSDNSSVEKNDSIDKPAKSTAYLLESSPIKGDSSSPSDSDTKKCTINDEKNIECPKVGKEALHVTIFSNGSASLMPNVIRKESTVSHSSLALRRRKIKQSSELIAKSDNTTNTVSRRLRSSTPEADVNGDTRMKQKDPSEMVKTQINNYVYKKPRGYSRRNTRNELIITNIVSKTRKRQQPPNADDINDGKVKRLKTISFANASVGSLDDRRDELNATDSRDDRAKGFVQPEEDSQFSLPVDEEPSPVFQSDTVYLG